jgi:aspartate/methionine/tyrosine aminotransferase
VPDGAFYVYIDVRGTGLDSMHFCERALDEAGVALTPGHDFGECSTRDHVRLSYAASREQLHEGLERLGRFVRTLPGAANASARAGEGGKGAR